MYAQSKRYSSKEVSYVIEIYDITWPWTYIIVLFLTFKKTERV